jgi:proteasome lid subunit RPN8/RPN11
LAISLYEWTIVLDHWLLTKLAMFRQERLPNETGGVLVGNFDTQRRICFLVDSLPSPPDSEEWPMSYIRGCEGLREKVRHIESLTLKQLGYVGEWHSHPDGCPTRPSADDYKAYSWLVGHMQTETLPGIMLIIGENLTFSLVSTEPGA